MVKYGFINGLHKWNVQLYVLLWLILWNRFLISESASTARNYMESGCSRILEPNQEKKVSISKVTHRNKLNYRYSPYHITYDKESNGSFEKPTSNENSVKTDENFTISKENEMIEQTKVEQESGLLPCIILLNNCSGSNQTFNICTSTIIRNESNSNEKNQTQVENVKSLENNTDNEVNEKNEDPYHPYLDHSYHIRKKGIHSSRRLFTEPSETNLLTSGYYDDLLDVTNDHRINVRLVINCMKSQLMKAIEKIVVATKIDKIYSSYRVQRYFLHLLLKLKNENVKNYHGCFKNTLQIFKKMYNFIIHFELRFLSLEVCKRSIDLLDSFDLAKILLVTMFLFDKDIFKNRREGLVISVRKKRKLVREYLMSRNGFHRYIHDPPYLNSRLLFRGMSANSKVLHDLAKTILLLGRDKELFDSNEIYIHFYNIRVFLNSFKSNFITFQNSLSDLISNTNSMFISQYSDFKGNMKLCMENILNDLINRREYIRDTLRKRCKEETIIRVLYFNIGNIMIKRILLDSKEIREVSIMLDSFCNLINICEKFLTAYQLLKLSENKNDSDPMDSEEADDLLRLALYSVYLKILYITFFEIREKLYFMFIVLDQYMEGKIDKESMKNCFLKSHEIRNLCELILIFLSSIFNYAKFIKNSEHIFEMGSILNMKMANMDVMKMSVSNDIRTDEYVKIGKHLIKKIYETYENMSKLLEDTT